MKRIMSKAMVLGVGVMAVVGLALLGTANAVTISSNVALFQPVSVESGDWGISDLAVMTDDVDGTRISTEDTLSGLWVDLGQEYNIESVFLSYRYGDKVKGAKLHGFAADQMTEVGTPLTVSTTSTHSWTCDDWTNVQWIMISDEGASPTAMTDTLREIRAYSQVQTYGNFITGVTATADSTYTGLNPNAVCGNGGMSDQRGPVGDPSASSIASAGFWHSATGTTSATITFDLGGTYNLSQMGVWNLNQLNHAERCVNHATIKYSLDGTDYTELADTNGSEDGNYTISQILYENAQNTYSLSIDMTGISAHYVSITALDTYTTELDPADVVGLSKVRFYGTLVPDVPVPGDTDNDGDVDTTDATTMAHNWGRTQADGGNTIGDFNADGAVNAADASILAANWTGTLTESAAVPEPLAATLLLSLLLVAGAVRPRRWTH